MSTTVTVSYGSQQKAKVKVKGNAALSQLLQDAVQAFGLPAESHANYQLKYKGVALNPSTAFTLSGIPTINGQVELCEKNGNVVYRNCKVSIGGDVENSVKTFKSNASLNDVVNEFALQSIVFPAHFSIVCLRQTINRDKFESTTLYDLGLDGQSAKLQIRKLADLRSEALSEPMEVDTAKVEAEHADDGENKNTKANRPHSEQINSETQSQKLDEETKTVDTQAEVVDSSKEPASMSPASLPNFDFSLEDLKAAIEEVLNKNFDQDSRKCLLIVVKYLDNLIKFPYAAKYRSINTTNSHFQNNISRCHAEGCLLALGFQPIGVNSVDKLEFSYDITSRNSSQSQGDQPLLPVESLYEARRMLVDQLEVLGTPREDIPPLPPLPQRTEDIQQPIVIPFDPFKPLIVSTSPAEAALKRDTADSGGKTNHELEVLKQRKLEIEGSPESVFRQTIVYIVNEDRKSSIEQNEHKDSVADAELDSYNPETSKSLIAAIKRLTSENDTPLTTKALKELQRLKSELVYNETTIKIRILPNVIAVGHFHPRHSINTIVTWLRHEVLNSSLFDSHSQLKIFRAPPKEFLSDEKTLGELGLIPAATLYISGLPIVRSIDQSQLLNPAVAVVEIQSEKQIEIPMPKAQKLLPDVKEESKEHEKEGKNVSIVESKASTSAASTKKMPAWFKLK